MLGALGGAPAWSSACTSFTRPRAAAVASLSAKGSMLLSNANTLTPFLPPSAVDCPRPGPASRNQPAPPLSSSPTPGLAEEAPRLLLQTVFPPENDRVFQGGAFHSEQAANVTPSPLKSPHSGPLLSRVGSSFPGTRRKRPAQSRSRPCRGARERRAAPHLPPPANPRLAFPAGKSVSELAHSIEGKFLLGFLLPTPPAIPCCTGFLTAKFDPGCSMS